MKINKHYAVPTLLLVIFLMPFGLALWSYQSGLMRQTGFVNKGHLLKKTVFIPELQSVKKWQLAYVSAGQCDQVCMKAIDTLARIRLALGRRLYGLDMTLLLPPTVKKGGVDEATLKQLKAMDVSIYYLNSIPEHLANASVWVVDNHAHGMLTYQDTANPPAIYSDLKKLSELWAG